ncbi:hypothetical protein [Phenylobacterium sp.]|uniref:hypothetical protein n=1 Tax=Phenylobacterium sp. TaxID=1871053 RepID=UPI002F929993
MAFALDHVWIATAERDVALAALSAVTGRPVLDGWTPGGEVRSRGVRFGNGAFLDVHGEASGFGASLLLRGSLDAAEALAAAHGWSVVRAPREDAPEAYRPPWSILAFRRRQGALSHLAVIAYEAEVTQAGAEYAVPLYTPAPGVGPTLSRVWVGGDGAEALAAFGCPGLEVGETDGVSRIEIAGAAGPAIRIGEVEVVFAP